MIEITMNQINQLLQIRDLRWIYSNWKRRQTILLVQRRDGISEIEILKVIAGHEAMLLRRRSCLLFFELFKDLERFIYDLLLSLII